MILNVSSFSEKRQQAYRLHKIFLLAVICCMAALAGIGASCKEVSATEDYYLDSTAPAGGDGLTPATAWNDINAVSLAAADKFVAGNRIKFKRGSIFHGSLWVRWSGEPGNPIVFESYEDVNNPDAPLPVIDGSRDVGDWTVEIEGSRIYSAATVDNRVPNILNYNGAAKQPTTTLQLSSIPPELTANAVLVFSNPYGSFWVRSVNGDNVSGITRADISKNELYVGQSLKVRYLNNGIETTYPTALTVQNIYQTGPNAKEGLTEGGDWYWDSSNNRVYLYSEAVPDDDTVRVSWSSEVDHSRYHDTVRVDASGEVVHDVIFQDLKVQHANRYGVVLFNCNNITVQGLTIDGNAKGGVLLWNADENIIENNMMDSNAGGVTLYAPTGNQTNLNQVRNNTIANCRGACIGLSSDLVASPGDVSGNVIEGNTITMANTTGYDGAGVYTFNAGSNTIRLNHIRNCGSKYLRSAGVMVDIGANPMTITGNTIENNSMGGVVVSGAGHQITNNTFRNNGIPPMGRSQIGFFEAGTPASNCTVTGNTMIADEGYHFINAGGASNTSGHTINKNAYIGKTTEQFLWQSVSSEWMDFETWKAQTGHDLDSTYREKKSTILLFLNGWIRRR